MLSPQEWNDKVTAIREHLKRHAERMLHDERARLRYDASDLVQQTLEKAWDRHDDFRGSTDAELYAWVQTIMRTKFIDEGLKQTRDKRDIGKEQVRLQQVFNDSSVPWSPALAARQPGPVEIAEAQDEQAKMRALLQTLEPRERLVVQGVYYDRRTLEDIGRDLPNDKGQPTSKGQVYKILAAALAKLRARMT